MAERLDSRWRRAHPAAADRVVYDCLRRRQELRKPLFAYRPDLDDASIALHRAQVDEDTPAIRAAGIELAVAALAVAEEASE